eukprot:scaffold37999_cov60-Phaeocystis_antarctica.AAC.8
MAASGRTPSHPPPPPATGRLQPLPLPGGADPPWHPRRRRCLRRPRRTPAPRRRPAPAAAPRPALSRTR